MSEHRIYRNGRLYDSIDSKSRNVAQICRSYANDSKISNPGDYWVCCDETGIVYFVYGAIEKFLQSDKVDTGITVDRHSNKFFQKYHAGSNQILSQQNVRGEWHSYINGVHKIQHDNEQQALEWVERFNGH